ncbi:MAG: hypothetical protein WAN66_26465 [Limnoraphis robusta]
MLVSNLTVEQLQDLIRHTVEQCLEEYFGDPDVELNVKPEVQQKLQAFKLYILGSEDAPTTRMD